MSNVFELTADVSKIQQQGVSSSALQLKKKKSGGFESMNLIYSVYKAIKAKGYNVPTPIQRRAIPSIMQGRDVIACSRTGSGKTAAFLIPLINRLKEHSKIVGTRALIILPTRELALQTSSVLKQLTKFTDLNHTLILGGHHIMGQFESLASNPDVIIATPGRLMQHMVETGLTLQRLEVLIFDEADMLFEMGFAEQMKELLKCLPPNRQTLMFSATIPEELSSFAKAGLKDYQFVKLDSEFTLSENMQLNFVISKSAEKTSTLIYLLQEIIPKDESSIVFVPTKYHVDYLVEILSKFKITNVGLYGKMDMEARKLQVQEFKNQYCKAMIVTDLVSRGIDLPFVKNIIHYDFPVNVKQFIHRCGRTARAGRQGTIYCITQINELMYMNEIILHVNRALSNQESDLQDSKKACYGLIPFELVNEIQEQLEQLYQSNDELLQSKTTTENAMKKFLKTRENVSKASIKNQHLIQINQIHPLFKDKINQSSETSKFLSQITNYKPKQSFLEMQKYKLLNQGETIQSLNKSDQQFLYSIKNMNRIESKKKEKLKLKEEMQKMQNSFINQGEDELENETQQQPQKKQESNNKHIQVENYRVEFLNEPKSKKIKKSQMSDFKHPTQYISAEPNVTEYDQLEKQEQITQRDINPFIIAEDFQDLLKQNKKYIWDKQKRNYVRGKKDELGRIKRDKEDKIHQNDKNNSQWSKKQLSDWSKKNKIKIQKEGEEEDQNTVNQAKELFKKRILKRKGFKFDQETQLDKKQIYEKTHRFRSELKSAKQILNQKKKKRSLKLKNMDKGKRKEIINKHKFKKFQ